MRYWHSTESQRALYAYILSIGLRPGDLLDEVGLPRSVFINSTAWVEREATFRLVHHLAEVTGDAHFGLHVGAFFRFDEFGPWGRGILAAPTLGEALAFASRETPTVQTGTRLNVARNDKRVRIWVSYDGTPEFDHLHHDQTHLILLKTILDLAEEPVPIKVAVACARASQSDDFLRAFGSNLDFRCGSNFLEFNASALELSTRPQSVFVAKPGILAFPDGTLGGRTAFELIRRVICYERPNILGICDALDINLRAFQRQLDGLGLTFRHLVDEHRQACALADLSVGRLSVTEIAFRLGYSDSAHFTRAVRRWTGCCPRELLNRPIPSGHWLNRRVKFLETTPVQSHSTLLDQPQAHG